MPTDPTATAQSSGQDRITDSAACPYCGLTDHTGREHLDFVVALSDPKDAEPEWWHDY